MANTITLNPAQLFVAMVNQNQGEYLAKVAKTGGARGATVYRGHIEGPSRLLKLLSLADEHQDIVHILMYGEAEQVIKTILKESSKKPDRLGGLAFTLEVKGRTDLSGAIVNESKALERKRNMECDYQLITVIANEGQADEIMAVARQAGATGGTIMTARGTGTEEDIKFFGITLVPEKETIYIVSQNSKTLAIMEAICAIPKLQEPGGGIAYTMDLSGMWLLGQNYGQDLTTI